MYATKLIINSKLSFSMSLTIFLAISAATNAAFSDESSDDFGPYSNNPAEEMKRHLNSLGDWNTSVSSLDEALSNFYTRTKLPVVDDPTGRMLDIDMVVSAEREANRVLGEDTSEEMQAYAYAIAPWLKPQAITVAVKDDAPNTNAERTPANNLVAERSALTSAISSLNNALKGLSDTVDILY